VDIAESILRTARKATAIAGFEPELVRANLESLPFGGEEFDLVVAIQVLEHLLDPAAGRTRAREGPAAERLAGALDGQPPNAHHEDPRTRRAGLLPARSANGMPAWRSISRTAPTPRAELIDLLATVGLEVTHARTFRFSMVGAPPGLLRAFHRIDSHLPDVGIGDVLLVVARRTSCD
jgi:hypothetical protein